MTQAVAPLTSLHMSLPSRTWTMSEDYAGLRTQAGGLAEAAGLAAEHRTLVPRGIWRHVPPALWPSPLTAVAGDAIAPPWPELAIGCGGKAAAVLARMRRRTHARPRTVIVQHPRMAPRRFDLVVVARHDELTGPNVLVTRTAIHRATPERLAEAARRWAPAWSALPRPLVAVLVGGSNGRFRLGQAEGEALAVALAGMMQADRVGLVLTPSRRTSPSVVAVLRRALEPLGGMVWDGTGENPYFGMLALADAIVVTVDSVSMLSEAVATRAPVMTVALPGRSRRIGLFSRALVDDGRVRPYLGRMEAWAVEPVDDTPAAAHEMCRRFGY